MAEQMCWDNTYQFSQNMPYRLVSVVEHAQPDRVCADADILDRPAHNWYNLVRECYVSVK